jgi:hypothetical protein
MGSWNFFKMVIRQWVQLVITDDEFYDYLRNTEFECAADRRVADLFIRQHDEDNWRASYHHPRV